MPLHAPTVSRPNYIENLPVVSLTSAASPCLICLLPYTTTHVPVLLQPCGHIFGRTCIIRWFDEGKNTCPLDRTQLFQMPLMPPTDFETRIANWRQLPFRAGADADADPMLRSSGRRNALVPVDIDEGAWIDYGLSDSEHEDLLRLGCRCLVAHLWNLTGHMHYQQVMRLRGSNGFLSFDMDSFSIVLREVIPTAIRVPDRVRAVLLGIVNRMGQWHFEDYFDEEDFAPLSTVRVDRLEEEILSAFGDVDENVS